MFNSPEHRGDDGHRPGEPPRDRRRRADDAPEHRRGHLDRLRAGDRDRRGAEGRPFKIFSGLASGSPTAKLDPFIHNMHTALWVLAPRRSSAPASRSCARATSGPSARSPTPRRRREAVAAGERRRRFGSARSRELTGTTPRTIRYYEEIGLLAGAGEREPGRAPHLRRGGRRAPARAAAAQGAARRLASTSCASWSQAESARAVAAPRVARGDRGPGAAGARCSRRRSATSSASSSSSAVAATRSPSSSASCGPSAAACAPGSPPSGPRAEPA